jgi:preprotein translocase subunit SecF
MLDFVGKRYWYFLLSGLVIVPGIVSLIAFHLKPGVDFSGGTAVTFHFSGEVKEAQLRTDLKDLGYGDAVVQHTSAGDFFVRLKELTGDDKTKLVDGLQKATGYTVTTPDYYTASATVGSKTARDAAIAVIVASVIIMLYITVAFRRMPNPFRWGTCAVVALAHDVLVVAGIFSLLGWIAGVEVDSLFITGMLTVVGYSVHDTIVVFDRIRENTIKGKVKNFEDRVNFSIVETLIRSLNTSFTVFLAVLTLFLIGGSSIHNFVLVLLIGIITGTYSSIFNASMLLVVWEKGELSKLGKLIPWRAKA